MVNLSGYSFTPAPSSCPTSLAMVAMALSVPSTRLLELLRAALKKISFHHPRVTPNVLHTNNKLGNNQPPFIVYIYMVGG
jgi:hypothetical protein